MIFEVCIDSVEGALAARQGGAQRVELCDSLVEGGTTPSYGMIELTCRSASPDVNVMIRPRGGDFVYSDLELDVMKLDIQAAKKSGAKGVVFGLLKPDGRIDKSRTRELIELARPLSVTFHRAFDLCADPAEALEDLIGLGVDRLLTSGQKADALKGTACIKALVEQARGRIIIMAGGGVNEHTLPQIAFQTGVNEVHFAARLPVESPMQFKVQDVHMGKAYQPDEYLRKITDTERVKTVIQSLN
ncbi:MAG: copper homeostasis protein CutC [Leptolinea sp.]|nr:copper homeostasis protein CutC [Leptolinea sp.]